MLWLTPAMDRLFIEGASGRRKFLDVSFWASTRAMRAIPRATRRPCANAHASSDTVRANAGWLAGLESEMAETGAAIALARAATVERLNRSLSARGEAGEFPAAHLTLSGEMETLIGDCGEDVTAAVRARLEQTRLRDAETGRTLFGPHLGDMDVRHTAKRAEARDCSTGEQKALLISIVLAHAWALTEERDGLAPVLLLDEIAAHLDRKRRTALFEEVVALGAQAWMTGTDLSLFEGLGARADIIAVASGVFDRV